MIIDKLPECFSKRVIKRFALFPTIMSNNDKIWLQYYYELQVWAHWYKGHNITQSHLVGAPKNEDNIWRTLYKSIDRIDAENNII